MDKEVEEDMSDAEVDPSVYDFDEQSEVDEQNEVDELGELGTKIVDEESESNDSFNGKLLLVFILLVNLVILLKKNLK